MSNSPAPKVLLFDMDDTLFDHRHARRRALARAVRSHGDSALRRVPLELLDRRYVEILERLHRAKVLTGELTIEAARALRYRSLFRTFGVALSRDEAIELGHVHQATYRQHRRTVPGSLELLRRVHASARIGIVTNNLVAEQEEKIRRLGLSPFLDFTVISEEAGVQKPDPAIFRIALDRAGCSAEQARMIGDSWENDVRGAMAAGIRPIWFNRYRMGPPENGSGIPVLRSFLPTARAAQQLLAPV
jgi:HAD superfamily hydrolase (TIGR01549 family)